MNSWGLGGGFLSGPSGGSLDLEPSMHRHPQSQLGHTSTSQQHQINLMSGTEHDYHHGVPQGLTMKANNRGKAHAVALDNWNMSDEDEPSFEDGSGGNSLGAKGKKGSPWQRMKWTDDIVRLLIAVVSHVGDDGTLEGMEGLKRKSGFLQKKGKWKTVSKVMIKKGCHVSPQQCEDKFNDLNKRYKRLNDILGKGVTCKVVENPALMDSMPQLSSKAKDDVRKILSSKHLFYQEMCAYHNGQRIPNCPDLDLQVISAHVDRENSRSDGEAEDNDGCDDDEDDDSDSDNEDDEHAGGHVERMERAFENNASGGGQEGNFELQMVGKSTLEQKEWIKVQKLHLLERKILAQTQSFELEKQRFKWQRYCSKKQRELERLRLENERMNLENERMELQLRQKELEIGSKKPDLSLDPTSLVIERIHGRGRDQIDLSHHQ